MMDIDQIKEILPHRYPFLLVDKVLECTSDNIVGIKNVTVNEPFFVGHFPGSPIMPGVLILEAMAQTGGLLVYTNAPHLKGKPIYFAGIDNVRFRKPVRPGDQIVMKVKHVKHRGNMFKMRGEAFVDGKMVAEADLMAAIGASGAETAGE